MDDDTFPGDAADPVPANTRAVEPKVAAATSGAGLGAVVASFVLWLADRYVMTPGVEGDLPAAAVAFVTTAASIFMAFVAGYLARHQYRALPPDPLDP